MKPENPESEVINELPVNVNDDEAETEKFINRLALQRKLLINFIDPMQTSDTETVKKAPAEYSK